MMARAKKSKAEPVNVPPNAGTWQFRDHQEVALFTMDCNPSLGIFYDMGCGKTSIAIEWIRRALLNGMIEDALIICPAALIENWKANIDKHIMFEGVTAEDIARLRKAITVVSYQRTYKVWKKDVHHRNGEVSVKKGWDIRPELDRMWGAIFVDESQNIGNHSSAQANAAMTLAYHAPFRYCLSATPVHGGGGKEDYAKLFGQIQFLEPGIFRCWDDFCKRCVLAMDKWHKPSLYNVKVCTKLLTDHSIVCRIQDVLDMPERTFIDLECELLEKQVYKDIHGKREGHYGMEPMQAGARGMKMLQICSGSMKRAPEEGGPMTLRTSKDDTLKEILTGTSDKVVVFCMYTASVDRVMALAKKCGRNPLRFDGTAKKGAERQFQDGPKDLICAQYAVGGPGVDLFASHTCVFYEPCSSAEKFEQAHGRIYRQGQVNRCIYYYLVTPKTIEVKRLNTVREGKDVTNKMMAEWAMGELEF